jgi:uncharacterized protein (TIGR01777 family)
MRVLVTGASGLIGSAVCDALLARGDEVVGLTRDPERARPKNPTVRWHAWQPVTERPPPEAFEEVNAVVNLIGEEINQRLTDRAKKSIRDSRITASKNLLQGVEAARDRPRVFVGQSAVGYYGHRGEQIVDEDAPPGPSAFDVDLVVEWEAAERQAETVGMRVVILRTAPILTKTSGLLRQLLLPFKLGLGGPIAGGDQYLPWIHLDDEVGMILWALGSEDATGAINAAAPNAVTNREFSKALGRALNRPAVIPVPKLAVAAIRGRELAEIVSGGARVVPRRAQDLGYRFKYERIDEAMEAALR